MAQPKKRRTKAEKEADARVVRLRGIAIQGAQIDVFDLSKVQTAAEDACRAHPIDDERAIERIRGFVNEIRKDKSEE